MATDLHRIADHLIDLQVGQPNGGNAPNVAGPVSSDDILLREAQRIFASRRRREQFFDAKLFHDPVWDILLDLFIAQLEGKHISVSSSCLAASVPPTTALRTIAHMTEIGLIERHGDSGDGRRVLLALGDRTEAAMRRYLSGEIAGAEHGARWRTTPAGHDPMESFDHR